MREKNIRFVWEETENEIRHRLRDPEDFRADTFRRRIIADEGGAREIALIVGRLKPEKVPEGHDPDSSVAQAVRFKKKTDENPDGWTMSEAKTWTEKHPMSDFGEDHLVSATNSHVILDAAIETKFAKMTQNFNGDIQIAGWFVTEKLIEGRDLIVRADAFDHADGMKLFNGRLLAFHNEYNFPVGEVTNVEIKKGVGLYGTATIWKENPEIFKRAIREGLIESFSIGFQILEYTVERKTNILTVSKATLKEVSVVNIGADERALFEVKNSLTNHNNQRGLVTMDKNINLEEFMTQHEKLGAKVSELTELYNAVKDVQEQFAGRMITKGELAEKLERFGTELETMRQIVETAKNQAAVNSTKLAYNDFRSLITDFVWLTDDNGNKLGEVAQRAHCLFQLPVDYNKMTNGYELKNLRDLYDAMLIADAMGRYKSRDRYNMRNLKLFKQLIKATEAFDKDVALAMAGGNAGYGAEWLPTEMSAEFNEILRTLPMLPNKIATWNMTRGGSAQFPFQNGRAVVYKGSEALVDNTEEARKTNIATGAKTFTPVLFIGALLASQELTEDTILDMVQFVRTELSKAMLEGLESAAINGDDSATHFDNTEVTTYEPYQVETAFKGLRKLSIANAVSAADTVNGLVLSDFVAAKQKLGVAGLNPADCVYVTGIKGKAAVQAALFAEDALGVLAFMLSGTIPNIDGSEVYISGQYNEGLYSAGVVESENTKYTSMVCCHKPSFRFAQRRGVTLEFNKNILTQQQQFVSTGRWDFGKICADSVSPVSCVIRMKHTA